MVLLIIGYPGSGKSEIAENMAVEMSRPGERIYLATMIPYGEEGRARVERHRRMREGKGFETIEAPLDICGALEIYASRESRKGSAGEDNALSSADILNERTVLLECVSNLTANVLFGEGSAETDVKPEAAAISESGAGTGGNELRYRQIQLRIRAVKDRLAGDIRRAADMCGNLVIVSNHFEVEPGFDEETRVYAETLDRLNDMICSFADRVIRLPQAGADAV